MLGRGNDRIARETIKAWHTGTTSINRCVAPPAAYQALRVQLRERVGKRKPRLNTNPNMSVTMADTHSAAPQPGSTSPAGEKADSGDSVNKIASLGRQPRSLKLRTTAANVSTLAPDVD
ncbi:hypothetical protein SprV_0401713300 [Sparganum proliferum]